MSSHLSTSRYSNITSYEEKIDHSIRSTKGYTNIASLHSHKQVVDDAIRSEISHNNASGYSHRRLVDQAIRSEKANNTTLRASNLVDLSIRSERACNTGPRYTHEAIVDRAILSEKARSRRSQRLINSFSRPSEWRNPIIARESAKVHHTTIPSDSNILNYQQPQTQSVVNTWPSQSFNVPNYQQVNHRMQSEEAHNMMQYVAWPSRNANASNYEWQVNHGHNTSDYFNMAFCNPNMASDEKSMGEGMKNEEAHGDPQNLKAFSAQQLEMLRSGQPHGNPQEAPWLWQSSNNFPYYY
ncbi:hypothetical protein VNO78_25696 [Psophocarpus tetragonolobus]|uniref:Uncharacterized protein n=1 Tax=Psophocarpus tetragonolobus TaxID=3891 RepID=A0AAN9XFN3_PSOTE